MERVRSLFTRGGWVIAFLVVVYLVLVLVGNVTAARRIRIESIEFAPLAVALYALTFTIVDLINELIGRKGARRIVLLAFTASALFALYIEFSIVDNAAPFWDRREVFAGEAAATPRIISAGLFTYLLSSWVDTGVFDVWRHRIRGFKGFRVIASNAVSLLLDSTLFAIIAFAGSTSLWPHVVRDYPERMLVTIVSLPLIYLVTSERVRRRLPPEHDEH